VRRFELKRRGQDEVAGILEIDEEQDIWRYTEIPGDVQQPWFVLAGKAYTEKDVKSWVLNRAPEENYELISGVLEEMGLSTYDPYQIFLKNKGRFVTDNFYIEEI
jgi:hypothetical protein